MAEENKTVTMHTSMGEIEFELYWLHAPKTCHNFYELASKHYYDGTIFHRIIRDFMVITSTKNYKLKKNQI